MNYFQIFLLCCASLFFVISPSSGEYGKLTWIDAKSFVSSNQQEQAGSHGSDPLYIARVEHNGGHFIGSYDAKNKIVAVNGPDSVKSFDLNGQILVYPKGTVSWTNMKSGNIGPPQDVILGGFNPGDMETIFVCRAIVEHPQKRQVYIGTWKPSDAGGCRLAFNNGVIFVDVDFEVLSLSFLGIATGAGND